MSLFSIESFDRNSLPFSLDLYSQWITIPTNSRLFKLLAPYIASHRADQVQSSGSYEVRVLPSSKQSKTDPACDSDEDEDDYDNSCAASGRSKKQATTNKSFPRIGLEIGTGCFAFTGSAGQTYFALYQSTGKPVGTSYSPAVYKDLVIFTKDPIEQLAKFLSDLVEASEDTSEGEFTVFTWNICNEYWASETKVRARPMASVVLPHAVKNKLVVDMEKFLSPRTQDFYVRNGIPYRRSYLFHGIPGTGKTSLVQALAGHFGRSVCFLMPTHPKMTDDSLRAAMNSLPADAIIVFEDIDSLFAKDRSNKVSNSSITFSGLLNALDGIGNPNGQIYVLTTNLRDQLDPALIRNGRVDLHIEFTYANAEQMQLMWRNFYPDSGHLAEQFSVAVTGLLQQHGMNVTTSGLQHFFVLQMDCSAEEALANVGMIVEEIKEKNAQDEELATAETGSTKESDKSIDAVEKKSRRRRKNRGRSARGAKNGAQANDKSGLTAVDESKNDKQ